MRSKALAKALPGKKLTLIQTIICAVLVLVMAFVSFGPIFTLDVNLDNEAINSIEKTLNDMAPDGNAEYEIPETIEVTLPFMLRSIGSIADVIGAAIDSVKGTVDNTEDLEEAPSELEDDKKSDKNIITPDLVNFIVFLFALIGSFGVHWLVGLCNILLLFLVFILPIVCIIAAIRVIIALIKNSKDIGNAFHKVAKALCSVISVFPMLLVVMVMVPEVQFGGAVTGILALCAAALVISMIASRLKYYEKAEFKYLNTVQFVSLGSLIAYMLFFFNIIKSEIMTPLFKRLGEYTAKEVGTTLLTKAEEKPDFIPVLLCTLFVALTVSVIGYLSQIVTRIACMSESKSESHLFTGILAAITAVLPFVLMNHEEFKLELSEACNSAYTVAAVGLFLLLVCEIVMMILSKTLCSGCSAENRRAIVTGAYSYELSEEIPAEEAPAEEAPAEEAPVEEAPAEETPAEEAPVEEAPAEEAPAEETPAEEAPVEEAPVEEAPVEEKTE